MTNLATALAAARSRKGFTQTELAKRAGVSQAAISRIEAGLVKSPGVDVLIAIARALDTTVGRLLSPKSRRRKAA